MTVLFYTLWFILAAFPVSLLLLSIFFFKRKMKAAGLGAALAILGFVTLILSNPFYSTQKELGSLKDFIETQYAIKDQLQPLIDDEDHPRLLRYRMKKPSVNSFKMIYCYADVYHLSDQYAEFIKSARFQAKLWQPDQSNSKIQMLDQHGQCIQALHANVLERIWVAPFTHRFSKEKPDYDDKHELMENSVTDEGSYLIFGQLHLKNQETAVRFLDFNHADVRVYTLQDQTREVLILLDLRHKLIKFVYTP